MRKSSLPAFNQKEFRNARIPWENGSTYSVKEERLGKGGEGSIHEIEHMPEYVAKIFKPDKRSLEREEKICNMTMNNMSEDVLQCITWPLDVCMTRMVLWVMS